MVRYVLVIAFLAHSAAGQDFDWIFKALDQQIARNVHTAVLVPGSTQLVTLSLRPQTDDLDLIMVGLADATVGVSLQIPTGEVLTETTAKAVGYVWETGASRWPNAARGCESTNRFIGIKMPKNQPIGDYVIYAALPRNSQPSTVCVTYASMGMGRQGTDYEVVGGSVKTDRKTYRPGDPVTISVPVFDGAIPVRNARVEAVVRFREDSVTKAEAGRIFLSDPDLDGIYTGVFQPSQVADYSVWATISGRSRREMGMFSVQPLYARLVSTIVEQVGAGVRATMRFDIVVPGKYRIDARLQTGNGINGTLIIKDLSTGEQVIVWNISAASLQAERKPPPYDLVSINLVRENPGSRFGTDYAGDWVLDQGQWRFK